MIPCGLIINELVSNCLKHAFPDGEGEINITLHTRGEHEIELAVTDNGIGISDNIDFKHAKSLGLRLVAILAEDQLNGEMKLDKTEKIAIYITFRVT